MLENEHVFEETQTFKRSVLVLMLFASALFFFYVYVSQEFFNQPISESPTNPDGLIAGGLLLLVLFIVFRFSRYTIILNSQGVHFKFSPFHLTRRRYPYEEIKTIYVRAFSPDKEFGGRGLRYSFKRKTWMYTISAAAYCIEIEKKDGGKTRLGIEDSEQAEKALSAYYTQ